MSSSPAGTVIVGAGAAGLMAARTLAQAGQRVTILEARPRCGGRILPLPAQEFGYPAEAGAEYIHGAAPLTRALLREAGLSLSPLTGRRWSLQNGAWVPRDTAPHEDRFLLALKALQGDLPVAEFVRRHFAGAEYEALRQSIAREVEGYNNAEMERFSTLALRDQWLDPDSERQERVAEGYGALVGFLASECRREGVDIRTGTVVSAIEIDDGRVIARHGGGTVASRNAIVTLPLPLLRRLALPPGLRGAAAAADRATGFGAVLKFHLRFRRRWWLDSRPDLGDMGFVFGIDSAVPTWWTQVPAEHAVLTGWCSSSRLARFAALPPEQRLATALASLSEIFGRPLEALEGELVAWRATHWGEDPFSRGAYSYPTVETKAALAALRGLATGPVFLCGEALYADGETGTVEAALASGAVAARQALLRYP